MTSPRSRRLISNGRAIITVVGDVTPLKIKSTIERVWHVAKQAIAVVRLSQTAGTSAGQDLPVDKRVRRSQSLISDYLVHRGTRPTICTAGAQHHSRGQFQSRLSNIREEKGYSYGGNSGFSYAKDRARFVPAADLFRQD